MANTDTKPISPLRKTKTPQERHIKVNQAFYNYRLKQQSPHSGDRAIPTIQVKGHWLQQAGFKIDTPVRIRVMEGCLVMTAEGGS